jgi:hypothetical protein
MLGSIILLALTIVLVIKIVAPVIQEMKVSLEVVLGL